jgi:hypothetical protein
MGARPHPGAAESIPATPRPVDRGVQSSAANDRFASSSRSRPASFRTPPTTLRLLSVSTPYGTGCGRFVRSDVDD